MFMSLLRGPERSLQVVAGVCKGLLDGGVERVGGTVLDGTL